MSITAKFYTFSKRENSTKQPTGGASYNILLKDDCSITNPVITLSGPNPRQYNYAYISDFGRYYFVNDWVCNHNGLWTAHLSVDVLATYKTEIGASTEYVLRSASDSNEWVKDNLYPTLSDPHTTISAEKTPFTGLTYIIGIINGGNVPKFGAVSYYVMTADKFRQFMMLMLGNPTYAQWQEGGVAVDLNLVKSTVNPMDYITEAYALPYTPTVYGSGVPLSCGWYELDSTANYSVLDPNAPVHTTLGNISPIVTESITLPVHGQASSRGKFLYTEPYTRHIFNAGCFGDLVLDSNLLAEVSDGGGSIEFRIYGDCFGSLTMDVYGVYNNIKVFLSRERANVKMPIPIGQVNNNPLQFWNSTLVAAGNIASAAGSIASGSAAGAATSIASIGSGIISGAQALLPRVQKSGSQASYHESLLPFKITSEFNWIVDDDNVHRGRPLCKPVQISTLSGYILVSDADLEISGTYEENQKVKGYMNSGFYYE